MALRTTKLKLTYQVDPPGERMEVDTSLNEPLRVISGGPDIKNESQKVINDGLYIKNESQKVINEGPDIKNESQKVINGGLDIKNESQKVINGGLDIKNEQKRVINQSFSFINDALTCGYGHPRSISIRSVRQNSAMRLKNNDLRLDQSLETTHLKNIL